LCREFLDIFHFAFPVHDYTRNNMQNTRGVVRSPDTWIVRGHIIKHLSRVAIGLATLAVASLNDIRSLRSSAVRLAMSNPRMISEKHLMIFRLRKILW
jgi:hypothetical protein